MNLIGTQAFLPATLSHIRNAASPAPLPIDKAIFQSILLCLISQDKHLIIRTPEEDLGLVVQLAVWTLSSIFDIKAHKVKIRSSLKKPSRSAWSNSPHSRAHNSTRKGTDDTHQPIDNFLRSLFLHPTTPASFLNHTPQDDELPEGHAKSHSTHAQGSTSRKQSSKHIRQASVPTTASHVQSRNFPDNLSTSASSTGLLLESPPECTPGPGPMTLPSIFNPQPLYAFQRPNQSPYTKSPSPLSHANTGPFPVLGSRTKKSRSRSLRHEDTKTPKSLSRALVISGLETASVAVQRSFSTVLGDKKVLLDDSKRDGGEWPLPDGFFCVYVCPWNARERPAIHKTLLDKFAMSTSVFISQSIRSDFRLLPFFLSSAAASPKSHHHPNVSYSNPGSPSASSHLPLPPTHTPPLYVKPLPGHVHQGSHSQSQSQRSPTQHSFSLTPPPFGSHVLPHMLHSPPLFRPSTPCRLPILLPPGFLEGLRTAYRKTYVAYSLDLYLSDLMSATRHDPRLDGTFLTAQSMKDARDLVKASRVIGADLTGMELVRPVPSSADQGNGETYSQNKADGEEEFHSTHSNPEALDDSNVDPILEVSEVDVARIFPRVVSHRLRLREGPHDEILSSVLYGATIDSPLSSIPEGDKTFDSVKAVLVNILSEV